LDSGAEIMRQNPSANKRRNVVVRLDTKITFAWKDVPAALFNLWVWSMQN